MTLDFEKKRQGLFKKKQPQLPQEPPLFSKGATYMAQGTPRYAEALAQGSNKSAGRFFSTEKVYGHV